jgi:hypothetical protein
VCRFLGRSSIESLPDDDYIGEDHSSVEMRCKQEDLDEGHVDLEEVEKNEESVISESGEDDEAVQGSGKVGADDGDVPLQDRVLGRHLTAEKRGSFERLWVVH